MTAASPILDQPQSLDYDLLPAGIVNRLANQDLVCWLDANSDVCDVLFPWGGGLYAQRITLTLRDVQEGPLTPLAVRFFPGHQETIAGSEGVIVTRRLVVPHKSPDDRALLWLLEFQAEGDRVVEMVLDVDWGEPLAQRIVDGLLVAQRNPQPARGVYSQSNAETTRVLGNPHGRPDEIHLDDPQRARLVYHVLVNGIVEVPLILTLSDVGEQVAWSGFLSLRDAEQVFDASTQNWLRRLQIGRLWTPEPALNRAVELGRLAAIRHVQRLRTGLAPTDCAVARVPALVDVWDGLDPVQSRNLLAHLRRVAEATEGRLPQELSFDPKHPAPDPGSEILTTNAAYLRALRSHLAHQPAGELLAEHLLAVQLCGEALLRLRWEAPAVMEVPGSAGHVAAALQDAHALASAAGDTINAARWESEWRALLAAGAPIAKSAAANWANWRADSGWQAEDGPWRFADPWAGMELAAQALWSGCGVAVAGGEVRVAPSWPADWEWWALLSLPLGDKFVSLLWDGRTLHATQPVTSELPTARARRILLHRTDEFDFDPYFEVQADSGDTAGTQRLRPKFR
jgi:hypothetical protein